MYRLSFVALVVPALLAAQRPLVEIGMDASIARNSYEIAGEDFSTTQVSIPEGTIRVGFFSASRVWSIEPTLGFSRTGADESSFSTLQLDVGALYHFATDPRRSQLFLRPFVGLQRVSFDGNDDVEGDESDSRGRLGVGVGIKAPLIDRLAARFEGRYARLLESDPQPAANEFSLRFGLSFFTR